MESASRLTLISIVGALVLAHCCAPAAADTIQVEGSTGTPGLSLRSQAISGVEIHYEMGSYVVNPLEIGGVVYQHLSLPQVFLPNDAGAPDLPGLSRFVAMPEGATARVEILSATTQTIQGIEISPAPVIPRDNDDSPLVYAKNPEIFGRNAFYPESPVLLSAPGELRGVDMVMFGLTPFQYNPVTKELVIYTELDVRIEFQGGNGQFGEDRLRSRYWEPILANHLINYDSLARVDFNQPLDDLDGYEYIIITPDSPEFIAWGDTLKAWRKLEGISTECFTTTEVGGTSWLVIEDFLNNAYNTWDPAPAAFLLLGDYPSSGDRDTGITSPTWNDYCISDNMYADVNGDDLPDMVHARIVARDAAELETMIGKMLDYERAPYTDPGFYDHPVIAGGWQTDRWFIICTEIVLGHQVNVLGKEPVREYAGYSGAPSTWSSNSNTYMLLDYFGPSGLGYIPATPAHLTDWGANATRLNNDLNAGAYMLLHRDHGLESGWGEPRYRTDDLLGLHNEMLPFVFSINCLTGKYNWSSECFSERFHRMSQGALGVIAASEISYSFVNDTFIFGLFDGLWPDFMPDYGPHEPSSRFATDLRPAFGMANGKHFLQGSSWPYNSQSKDVTHHLFHHFGDAFMTMYSEIPEHLVVAHDPMLLIGTSSFNVQADAGAVIGLTVDGEIIGVADATGMPQEITIVPQSQPGDLMVTVTMANHYRYTQVVPVQRPSGPYLVFDTCAVLDPGGDNDGVLDAGEVVGLEITLENVGVDPTTGVSAALSSTDPYVTITSSVQNYPDIGAGTTAICLAPYDMEIAGNTPDGHTILFTLDITANEGNWSGNFSLSVEAPVLAAGDVTVDDSTGGNGDGGADPGEVIQLTVTLDNIGHSATAELNGMLSSTSPDVVITVAAGTCTPVSMGGTGTMGTFEMQIAHACPSPSIIPITVDVSATNGFAATLEYTFPVGPWFDNCEQDLGWSLGVPGDNASTGIWIRDDPVGYSASGGGVAQPEDDHTPAPGTLCFVTGNAPPGSPSGTNDVDNGKTTLLSPAFDCSDAVSVTLTYWRWYTNNLGNSPGEDYWDVDVSNDGLTWISLEHTIDSANSWNEYTFDISEHVAFTDNMQFRFVAADESPGSLVEAAVDDIIVDVVRQGSTGIGPVDVDAVRQMNGIVSCNPNPFNPQTTIVYRVGARAPVTLKVFDVAGRMVRTLVDATVDPGEHTITFDGRNTVGQLLASGIYFLRMETPDILQVRQVTLLK